MDIVKVESNDSQELVERPMHRLTPEDLPTLYSNTVSMQSSLLDFRMDFGMILRSDREEFAFKDQITVLMSPQHAKIFSRLLVEHVEKYEAKFGPIPTVPKPDVSKPEEEKVTKKRAVRRTLA